MVGGRSPQKGEEMQDEMIVTEESRIQTLYDKTLVSLMETLYKWGAELGLPVQMDAGAQSE